MVLRSLVNKKSDPTDMLVVVIFMFILAVGFLIFYYFTVITSSALHNSPMNISETQTTIQSLEDTGTNVGGGYIFIIGGMVLGIIISAFWVREHPAFIPLYIIFIFVTIAIAALLGNAYVQVCNTMVSLFNCTTEQPLIDIVMRHTVRIALVVGVLSMIISLSKVFGGGQGGNQPF
jgi:hypothetical protein